MIVKKDARAFKIIVRGYAAMHNEKISAVPKEVLRGN